MATLMKRSCEEIATVGSEGEDVEGALNQSENKGDEGTLNQSEDEEGDEGSLDESEDEEGSDEGSLDESEDEEGDEGNLDESEDEPAEGTFQESDDEDAKSSFRAAWDYNLVFDEKSNRNYTEAQKKIVIQYHREMRETEGFGVTCDPDIYMMGAVSPVCLENRDSNSYKKVERCARYAIDRYNQIKNETLDLQSLEKATVRLCGAFLFYITFAAVNSKTYETKVFYHRSKPHSVALFREKKSPQVNSMRGTVKVD